MIKILNTIKIMDEINRLIVAKYPKRTVYIDLVPKGFKRPSFLIQAITTSHEAVNAKLIQETHYFTVVCFDEVDDYHNTSAVSLLNTQQDILDIFRTGYLKVDGRAIEVKASTGGRDFDKAYIDLQFEYFEDRAKSQEELPKMKDVYVDIKE